MRGAYSGTYREALARVGLRVPSFSRKRPNFAEYVAVAKVTYLEWLMDQAGTMPERARIAGVHRQSLYALCDRFGVER